MPNFVPLAAGRHKHKWLERALGKQTLERLQGHSIKIISSENDQAMNIRDAIESDIGPLARLHIAAWQAAYRGILPDELLDDLSFDDRRAMWEKLLRNPNRAIFVAIDGDDLVGFTSIYPARDDDVDPNRTGELTTMYVHPNRLRKGIGSALWREAHERLGARFAECILWVFRDNHTARRFYERIGFAFDGKEQFDPWVNSSAPEVRYRRTV
jgi:ribosomal protein S18 acetylase RimI-like enzyme